MDDRLFLEIERFDRTASWGRRGLISLRALDLEFVGKLTSWTETAESLFSQNRIDRTTYETILWFEVFGKFIGNSDRHHGNVSFFCTGEKLAGLAPVYDMLPMLYAPMQNQLIERFLDPGLPKFAETAVWNDALSTAITFWSRVKKHSKISEEFKTVAGRNETRLAEYKLDK